MNAVCLTADFHAEIESVRHPKQVLLAAQVGDVGDGREIYATVLAGSEDLAVGDVRYRGRKLFAFFVS